MSQAVQDIIQRIQQLPEQDRLDLATFFAEQAEHEWRIEAGKARQSASDRGIDQAAIDAAVAAARYGS
jgi:hypothetical protein